MRTSIILILGLTVTLTSCQSPWSSPGPSFPQSSYSQYQPSYRPSGPSSFNIPSPGQYQSPAPTPALSTLSQLSSYNRLGSPSVQSSPWSQSPASGNRGWSIPAPAASYGGISQPPSAGYSSYSRPAVAAPAPQPAQGQSFPFQASWSIQHGSGPAPQPAPRPFSLPAAQPQSYSAPSPPAQSWSPPPAPVQTWRAPAPAAAPIQTWRAPAPASQWSPPSAPAQTYSPPQPSPIQSPPQTLSSYSSPQNSQNLKPAPVHYASIGEQLQGDYKFGYHTGDGGSFREETRLPDGTVQGAYGFIDGDGKQRIVRYRAGKEGFQAEGDDVPKGTPVASDGTAAPAAPQPAAPINFEEGAAFRSFSQG